MNTVLKIIIEVICAAVVIYILFRETFEKMAQKLERQTRRIIGSVRNWVTSRSPASTR
jgi:flagellar biosynthesis protein FlhB